jgi:signal transduction histidine kinase
LYAAQKQELATINSHEVRNHLSNILGLLDLMNDKDNKGNELLKTKDYLQYSAEQLDKALKNVSKKLSD